MKMKKTATIVATLSASALVLSGCAGGSDAASDEKTHTMVDWGGVSQEISKRTLYEPWAEENGITLKEDQPTDYAKLEAMVQAGKVTWGTVEVEPNFTETACAAGTIEPLSQKVVDAAAENGVDETFMHECGIPILNYSFTIGYNTESFPDGHPTTWEEFFDTEKFPGKRGFWKYATGGIFEAALLADGVAPEDLYPLDIDRAFKKLDTIKDDIVWYDTGDQQVQLVSSGEAPLVQAWNGRLVKAEQNGQPVKNEYGENLGTYEHIVIPKGYENKDLAEDWMVWVLSNPEAQSNFAQETGYGPVSPAALDLIPEDAKADLANNDENVGKRAAVIDYGYWAENYDTLTERLNVWMAS